MRKMKPIDLSTRSGIAPGTISNYMLGKYKAKGENLRKLASALDVDPGWLEGVPEAPTMPLSTRRLLVFVKSIIVST